MLILISSVAHIEPEDAPHPHTENINNLSARLAKNIHSSPGDPENFSFFYLQTALWNARKVFYKRTLFATMFASRLEETHYFNSTFTCKWQMHITWIKTKWGAKRFIPTWALPIKSAHRVKGFQS